MEKQENAGKYSNFGLEDFQHIWESDSGRYHGWHMDALREWMQSDLDVIMVGTRMLCGNGWSLIWTLSWLAHGCSAGMDGV